MRKWYDVRPIKKALEDGLFPEYAAEVDRIYNSPEARWCKFKNRDRTKAEVAKRVLEGKIGEVFLRSQKERVHNLDEKTLEKYGKNHPLYQCLKENLIYHDLIDESSGLIIEVKWWDERYVDDFNSKGWRGLISALRKRDHIFPDKVIIFAKDRTNQKIRFHKCYDVETLLER